MAGRRLPPLNALRAFEAAARHLSFTRAADELSVTQAAVSHQVKQLEEWLGVPLFRRRPRAVLLTESGQAYLPPVREALDGLATATRRLLERQSAGVLNVSIPPSFAANWFVPRLGAFRAANPEIDVRLNATDDLVDFAHDDIDVSIRYGLGDWDGVEYEHFMDEEMFPVCAPALLARGKPLRRPDDLRHYTLLHDDMRENWPMWLRAAGARQVDPTRGPTFNLSSLVLAAAIDGQGVALGRSSLMERDLAAGRLVRPFALALPAHFAFYVVYPPRSGDIPKVRALISWLKATVAAEREAAELSGRA